MALSGPGVVKKLVLICFGLLALLLIAVLSSLLYVNLRLQQSLLNRTPSYTSEQLYSRAVEQLEKGGYQEAETYLEQALLQEEDSSYRSQLAVVKYRLKKYEQSIEQYQKLIAQQKDMAFAWNGIGNAYRDWAELESAARKADYQEKALGAYQKSLDVNQNYIAAYSNMALLLNARGEKAKALEVLSKGIELTRQSELEELRDRIAESS